MSDKMTIAWCDNGMVDGRFMQGITDILLHSGVEVTNTLRSSGNQIARQRELVIKSWYEQNKSDWIFWVDSDIVASPETFKMIWDAKDAQKRPIMTGVYFTSDNPEETMMQPFPTLFNWTPDKAKLARIHPMPVNQILKIGAAGMGFVLMHRSAITQIIEKLGNVKLFAEIYGEDTFTGEDIYFYSLCDRADVPVYAHTGATVPHMKRFSYDVNYYNVFNTVRNAVIKKQSNTKKKGK